MPSLDTELVTDSGKAGWILSWHNMAADRETILSESLQTELVDETNVFLTDATLPPGLNENWGIRFRGKLRARSKEGRFEFGLTVTGRGRLYVGGKLVIDNWTQQRQGDAFFGLGTVEEKGVVNVGKGEMLDVVVEFSNISGPRGDEDASAQPVQPGMRLGGRDVTDEEVEMRQAVECARAADVAIVVVGLNSDWESEGYDRTTLALPGRTDELVEKVVKANPRTVVVTQSVCIHFVVSDWITDGGGVCLLGFGDYDAMGRYCACIGARVVSW